MPTFRHGKNVNIFIDEYDFSTYFNNVSASTSVSIPPRQVPLAQMQNLM
jgi:hypothetical protein